MAASRFDPAANLYTDAEKLDASAPASSTIIKTMIVQSSYKEGYTEGPRYAYQYTYDASGRLVNLDCRGYLYKS